MKDLNEKISISLNEFEIEVERKNIGKIGIDPNFSISNIFFDAKRFLTPASFLIQDQMSVTLKRKKILWTLR